MLRVLHCIYDDPRNPWVGGGGAVRVFELYRRLAPRLVSITVATGNFPGARDEVIEGVRYVRLGVRRPYAWSRLTYSLAATRLLARGDYDVAVFDFSTYTLLRVPRNKPVGITVHHLSEATSLDRWGPVAGRVIAAMEVRRVRRARYFSATSTAMLDHLRAMLGANAQIHFVQAGVPDELFELAHAESNYVLFFGRLDWFHKGLDILLDAFAAVVRGRPDARLKIAGRGRDVERVTNAVRALGIAGNVDIIGAVDESQRQDLFGGAQLMIMPSRFEGFGLAAAEAMAAGVPLIVSDAGSLPEVVDPPRGGVIVPASNAVELARAIETLLSDPARRALLSASARISAERFRWAEIAEQHLAFLTAIHESYHGA